MSTLTTLDPQELAHVLAGLRLLQELQRVGGVPAAIKDIRSNGGTLPPFEAPRIDALCERLNASGPDVPLVAVKLNGGVVQGTVTNVPGLDVLVLDYDVERDEREFPQYPEHGEQPGRGDEACAYFESPLVDAAYMDQLRQLADADIEARE